MKLVEEIFQKNLHFLDTMFPPSQEQGLYGLIIKEQVICMYLCLIINLVGGGAVTLH